MVKGIATVTVQRGIDVREFALLSFGGAGGVHAIDLADSLDMAEVIVPPLPGVFSALGLLAADVRHDFVAALGGVVSTAADPDRLERLFHAMEEEARRVLAGEGFLRRRRPPRPQRRSQGRRPDLRAHRGVAASGPVTSAGIEALVAAFGQLYRERYAFFFEGEPIELVNLRLAAIGASECDPPSRSSSGKPTIRHRPASPGGRSISRSADICDADVFERDRLRPGMIIRGPAIVEEPTSVDADPPG